jgi:MFS family permease
MLYFASAATALGMLLMSSAKTMTGVTVFGSVVGAGIGLFLTSNWALANALAPGEQAGKFLGLTNIATAGAGALARLEGPALDALNAAWPGAWAGYRALFLCGAACILLSLILLARIQDRTGIKQIPAVASPPAG